MFLWISRCALAAVPDGVAFQQLFYLRVVTGLHDGADGTRIVMVEFRRRANGRADTAAHAGVQGLFQPEILIQCII